jgi:hypothetical protein
LDHLKWMLVALLVSACGSRLPYQVSAPQLHGAQSAPPALSGTFLTTDLATVDLSREGARPVVLIFSQDTCAACGQEADALRAALRHPTLVPANAGVYSILVGAVLDDAADWKSAHSVPWTVGMDPDNVLFKRYCATLTVPCSVVYLPGRGIVLQRNGGASLADFENLTGDWEN